MSTDADASLQFGQRVGILLVTEAAALSAAAVAGLLLYIAFSTLAIRPHASRHWKIDSALHVYLLNLLFFDLVLALGGLMNIRWVIEAGVTEGVYCSTQGAIKQLADIGASSASLIIALHTFLTLVFRRTSASSVKGGLLVLASVWIILAIVFAVDISINGASRFYRNTGYWCWISEDFPVQRMALDYAWMFVAALFNIVAYVPLCLVLKGMVAFDGWRIYRPKSVDNLTMRHSNRVALKMLIYPATYTFTVLPIAIVRWTEFSTDDIPFAATICADIIYVCSGLFNVILYSVTRPFLLPQRRARGRMVDDSVALSFSHPSHRHPPRQAGSDYDLRIPHSATALAYDTDHVHTQPSPVRIIVSAQPSTTSVPMPPPPPSSPSTISMNAKNDILGDEFDFGPPSAGSAQDRTSKASSWDVVSAPHYGQAL